MKMNEIKDKNGNVVTHYVEIIPGNCKHCGMNFNNEIAVALGKPFCCILHIKCVPFFHFNRWPHDIPFNFFLNEK